jgi:hypothetical protein
MNMSRGSLFLLLGLLQLGARAAVRTGESSNWPAHEIKVAKQLLLKDLFDAGLRLYRFPGLESSLLEQKHLKMAVVQSDGQRLPLFIAERLNTSVCLGGLVFDLELEQAPMTLAQTRVEMLRWIGFGKLPERTEADLDVFLKEVAQDFREYNAGPKNIGKDFALAWVDQHNTRYVVWCQSARHPITPLSVHLAIRFPLTNRESASYTTPIPPPPGYENFDMTAPRDFGPDSAPPNPELDRVMTAGVMPDETSYENGPQPLTTLIKKNREAAVQATHEHQPHSNWVWWLLVLGGGLGLSCVVVRFLRKHAR